MISAVILSKNEEKNIKDCLESIRQLADEIILIDDNSTDKTTKLAEESRAKIFTHSLNNNFAEQRNFGLQKAKGDWIFFIDADERVSPKLKKEIKEKIKSTNLDGFYLKRQDFFGGRFLKHGETANICLLRLGRKGKGKWQREVHETWDIKESVGSLKNPLWHYPHPTLKEFIEHVNRFSTLHAQVLLKEGVEPSLFRLWANPFAKFIQNYIFRLGFLDKTPGIIVALMMSFHSFLARAKLYQLWKKL